MKISKIINLEKYPINFPNSELYAKIVSQYRKELDEVGCCCLSNFVKSESINRIHEEIQLQRKETYWSKDYHNPYFTKKDLTLPNNHPKNYFQKRNSGFITADKIINNSDLLSLYESEQLLNFVSDCLNIAPIFKWDDPLARCTYSIMDKNHYFPWHFDANDFTLSILIQKAEKGGVFEYYPNIRNHKNENYEQVTKVLKGERKGIHILDLQPGDLQIFRGRFSLHRVTQIEGINSRCIALPTFVDDPCRINRPQRSIDVFGRALPIHYERESYRPDAITE